MSRPRDIVAEVHRLEANQMAAVAPARTVWLSASAGTGKTQVLTSRVLRLLLEPGVEPDQILCLTFTKAGAAEMATRIGEKLADWVRMADTDLATHLMAIGADHGPESLARARSRFAAVLDCPGGGLRIETIHAFSQWLLSAFPEEAGLRPGSRAMEDRERDILSREVLVECLVRAEETGDAGFGAALAELSLRMTEGEVLRFLLACAGAHGLWDGPGGWQPPLRPRINWLVGLPADADHALLAEHFRPAVFPMAALSRCLEAMEAWGTKTATDMLGAVSEWIALSPEERALKADELRGALHTQKDTVKWQKNLDKIDPGYSDNVAIVIEALDAVRELARAMALAERLEPALTVGRRFALAWDEAKTREGFIDFDDQIRAAAALLTTRTSADWIRFKLDRRFDHVLVDEAQDTNQAQWDIVLKGLTQDFFVGEGAKPGLDPARTLFVVGDYKQAIFGFQGTSPDNFASAKRKVAKQLGALAEAARDPDLDLLDLDLGRSFRSTRPVLEFVDRTIAGLGFERLGLPTPAEPHLGREGPGLVALWQPVGLDAGDGEADEDEGEETWLAGPHRELAARIAGQVRDWLDHGFPLAKGNAPRRAKPGDIMVLVRKRGDLAGLIVARLHAAGVPVAGVDRLRLGAPLAVKDLLAALRFAVQPGDDLNLASLLVSPLIGWSQEDLLAHGYRGDRVGLWEHLRSTEGAATHGAMSRLRELLARADFVTPAAMLTWLLVGPWQGRRALLARLGEEAGDPIDELVNAAMAYGAAHVPSLAGFLAWFSAGDGDVKREAGGQADLVRVMTVHGSKGLQAPIVIMADAAGDPDRAMAGALTLTERDVSGEAMRDVPLPSLRKEEKPAPVTAAEQARRDADRAEHWRLMYVAMTRAEEALFVTGALLPKDKGVVPAESWYAACEAVMPEGAGRDDPRWTRVLEFGRLGLVPPKDATDVAAPRVAVPDELHMPLGPEPRPLRPLAPSALGDDAAPAPPGRTGPGARMAARRGTLVHKLLERLPEVAVAEREAAAARWLARMGGDLPEDERAGMVRAALEVLDHPEWQAVFGPGSLAEVPVAALVGTRMVAGTIDRLLIAPEVVRIVDFKTDRRPPETIDAIPGAYLRQMAAYVAAMRVIHPGRRIEAALLYTAAPRLFALPDELIAAQKLNLAAHEESF